MKRITFAVCALVTMCVTACDAESPSVPSSSLELRGGSVPGNGDLTLYDGTTAGPPATPVWDIDDEVVSENSSGNDLLEVVGNEIQDTSGVMLCTLVAVGTHGSALRDDNGDTLYTVMDEFVFYGLESLPNPDFGQLAFTVDDDQVFEGRLNDDVVVLTADVDIEKSSDMRKALFAALIEGHCGSPGL